MKKIFLVITVIFAVNFGVYSQEKEKKITIQTSPLLFFSDVFAADDNDTLFAMDLETQFLINNNINISFILSFLAGNQTYTDYGYNEDTLYNEYTNYKENLFQINFKPIFIHRPFATGLKGIYLGFYPNFGFSYIKTTEKTNYYGEIGFGMILGYKFIFKSGFTIQIGGGIGKTFVLPNRPERYLPINSDGRLSIGHTTDIQILDFKLGYSF
jgi:hypothetical protein